MAKPRSGLPPSPPSLVSALTLSYTARRLTVIRFSGFSPYNPFKLAAEVTARQNIRQNVRKVAPGQGGTKRFLEQYGAQLVCVRYRYDRAQRKRYKTIELVVDEAPWTPPPIRFANATLVGVRVTYQEIDWQRQVKQAGGKWNPAQRVWELRYDQALALGLKDRIEELKVSGTRNS